jgi:hypothetical protein
MLVRNGKAIGFLVNYARSVRIALLNWGGRIRTSEWRDQNPLPYRLATPQQSLLSQMLI